MRTYEDTVLPVEGLINQRSGLGTSAAEDDSRDAERLSRCQIPGDAGAVLGRSGEAGVRDEQSFRRDRRCNPTFSPFQLRAVLGRILVETFPPNCVVVVIVKSNVGEDGVLTGAGKSVGVGLFVGAGSNAEEAVFGVDSPKSAVADRVSSKRYHHRRSKPCSPYRGSTSGGMSIARLVLPQAEGNAAAMYLTSPSGLSTPRMSICSAIQPSFLPW